MIRSTTPFALALLLSGLMAAPTVSPAVAADLATPPLYAQCAGTPFAGTSDPTRLPPATLAARTLAEWTRQFMAMHQLSQPQFDARIHVTGISISDGPAFVWARIDYTFALDWVRSRQAVSVNLGDYPLTDSPTPAAIARSVRIALRERDQVGLPAIAPRATVEANLRACHARMQPDWCGIRFENGSGRLLLWGHGAVDEPRNRCVSGAIDVASGREAYCRPEPCRVPGGR